MYFYSVEPTDVVYPPKFITARHVAAVFEKLGYDAAAGTKVFGVLLEILAKAQACALDEEGEEQDLINSANNAVNSANSGAEGAATAVLCKISLLIKPRTFFPRSHPLRRLLKQLNFCTPMASPPPLSSARTLCTQW